MAAYAAQRVARAGPTGLLICHVCGHSVCFFLVLLPRRRNGKASAIVSLRKKQARDYPDLSYLREKFLASFDYSSNVKLTIIFQRYDKDWEMFTDLKDDAGW